MVFHALLVKGIQLFFRQRAVYRLQYLPNFARLNLEKCKVVTVLPYIKWRRVIVLCDIDDRGILLPSSDEKFFDALLLLYSDAVVEHHKIYGGSVQVAHVTSRVVENVTSS